VVALRGRNPETHAYAFIHTDDIKPRIAELFGGDMHFDVIIGNPPYQLADGGHGASASPIYQLFVQQAKKIEPRYLTMVTPSRWFAGGKGLDDFRASMLADNRMRSINDYLCAADVFPGVDLKGGVCYFLWDKDNRGPCRVATHFKDWPFSEVTRPLLENGADIFIRFTDGVSILQKVIARETGQSGILALPETQRFKRLVSSRTAFGLGSKFRGKIKTHSDDDLLVYRNGGTGYIARNAITAGRGLIDAWKIFVGSAGPGTAGPSRIISTPFVSGPGSISSETYLCIGPFGTKDEAESAIAYLTCRLTRLLILLHKPSHLATRKVYTFVPVQEWKKKWTDADLYDRYGLTDDEIAFIEKIVRPMDLTSDASDDAVSDDKAVAS